MPTAKELIRNKTFLDVSRRSLAVGSGQIMSIAQNENIISFQLTGLTDTYNEYIRILALDEIDTIQYSYLELVDIISHSHLEVACTCPAYLYWGFQYIDAVNDAGLWIASISPDVRNPNLEGKVCKHLFRILSNWEEFAFQIATLYPYRIDPITIRRIDRNNRIKELFTRIDKMKKEL